MKRVIKSDKVKKDLYIKLFSDLHYVPGDNLSFLNKSVIKMKDNKPDYILFLGDLIDDSKYTKEQLKEVYDLVYRMSKLSKTLMVLGNHDQFTRCNGKWVDYYNEDYVNELKNRGVIVLQNESYQDDNIYVYGTKFSGDYYEEREPLEQFAQTINLVDFSDSNQFNILMEHSPNYTFNKDIVKLFDNLEKVDLTLAGHYHNGCIPWYIDKILPGNFGLMDPYMNILPKNARGVKKIIGTNLGIVSAPLTTFTANSGLKFIQPLYHPTNQNILIKKK